MPEQIQRIINRIIEWWKKFTRRQQVLIVSIALVVIVAIAILVMVVSKPKMVYLATADDAKMATEIKGLLDGENIPYENTDIEGLHFTVKESDYTSASLLLGSNSITTSGYSINDAIDGSFSTTEADKQKKYQLYLENKFEDSLETMSMVKSATVNLSIPKDDGTIIASQQEGYANVILKLSSQMSEDTAAGIARYMATCLGNDTTNNIHIMDTDGNVLFSGGDETSAAGKASSNQTIRDRTSAAFASTVRKILLATNVYDNVEVGMNLVMNFDQQSLKDFHYYVDEGMKQGYLDSYDVITTESNSGVGGVPGTTSNDDDTTYVVQDGENTKSETNEEHYDYLPSETITETVKEMGVIEYANSSTTVVATKYKFYREADLKKDGTLDDQTFEQFISEHSEKIAVEVPAELYSAVSNATGIDRSNISILAYEIPMFEYDEGSGRTVQDYLQLILAVLILAMLAFVVMRSLKREEEEETVEEVTLEDLITETEESALDDIGYSEKSEARLLIEKFVDEKPEAVAALLRNWLNEDWG